MDDKVNAFFKSYANADELLDVQIASERLDVKLPSISTGSFLLDDILGCGGYPLGRIIQLYGAPSSGKSLMAYLAIKEAQKLNSTSKQVYIDSENTFNAQWTDTLGVDTSRVIIVDGDLAVNGRRCFEMLLGEPKENAKHILDGKKKEGLLDKITNKDIDINLIVLDSLGAIIPPGEDVATVGKVNMALMARFLTTTFKKLALEVNKANVPFLVINHKRDNLDPYGVDHTFSGGNTYAHFLSCNIYFEAVMRKDALILDEKENKIGHIIRATTEKSKFCSFPKKCEFKVNFGVGIVDKHEEVAQLALDYDVVLRPSTKSYAYGDSSWVGMNNFNEAVKENPSLMEELLLKINDARNSKMDKNKQRNAANREADLLEKQIEKSKKGKNNA